MHGNYSQCTGESTEAVRGKRQVERVMQSSGCCARELVICCELVPIWTRSSRCRSHCCPEGVRAEGLTPIERLRNEDVCRQREGKMQKSFRECADNGKEGGGQTDRLRTCSNSPARSQTEGLRGTGDDPAWVGGRPRIA